MLTTAFTLAIVLLLAALAAPFALVVILAIVYFAQAPDHYDDPDATDW